MYYMSKFCVSFTVLNQEYYNSIERSLKELSKQDCKITIISEEKINTPFKNFVLKNLFINSPPSNDNLDLKIWKNNNLYKADPRYVNKNKNDFNKTKSRKWMYMWFLIIIFYIFISPNIHESYFIVSIFSIQRFYNAIH